MLIVSFNDYDTKRGFNLGFGVDPPSGGSTPKPKLKPYFVIIVTTDNQHGGEGHGGRNLKHQFYFLLMSMLRLAAMLISNRPIISVET